MMSDGALSQDEIEALLQGAGDAFGGAAPAANGGSVNFDKKLLNEMAKIVTDNQAFSLSSISTKTASISNVSVIASDADALQQMLAGKILQAKVSYSGSIQGNVYYFMRESEAAIIASLMMGQKEDSLNEMVSQVLREAFSQMVGVSDSALTSRFGGNFSNMPIETEILEDPSDINISGSVVIISGTVNIEGEIENAPYIVAMESSLVQGLFSVSSKPSGRAQSSGGGFSSGSSSMAGVSQKGGIGVQQADFNSLMPSSDVHGNGNIGLLMDVTMNMTVELGRATMTIRDILSLGEGSIIELQKLAGEPVDLLVNGKLIARGEVVVIDENFGVRVTDIINPIDRLTNKTR